MISRDAPNSPINTFDLSKGQSAYRQGDARDGWYEVTDGFIALCHYFGDGRRQVSRFVGPGDAFGFGIGLRQFSAEALTDLRLKRHTFQVAFDDTTSPIHINTPHPALRRAMEAVEGTIRLFSYTHASDRVAAFLLNFSRYGGHTESLHLPMSRQDLADHLGLTMHTVSRSICDLARRGYFQLERPDLIRISDRARLEQLVEYEPTPNQEQLVA